MMRLDLSIGQRLAIGFGTLLTLLAGGFAYLFFVQQESAASQARFEQRIVPRTELANQLQRAILYTGIDVRSFLLTPTDEARGRVQSDIEEAREALQALATAPMDAQDQTLIQDLRPLVNSYLLIAGRAIEERQATPMMAEQDHQLVQGRAAAFSAIQRFVASQTVKQNEALDAMATARERVRQGFFTIALLAVLSFLIIAFLITRSIRRPARELVAVAEALQVGNYQPALKWSNPDSSGLSPAGGSEMTSIARAFGAAASALERRERRLRSDASIAVATGSSLDKAEVGDAALRTIADHVRAEVAVLYWAAADGQMLPIAQRALNGAAQPVPAGAGLPGYAVQRRKPIIIRDIPRDTPFAVRVGYDSAPPRSIAIVPVHFRDQLLGVMVLASLHDFGADASEFLEAASRQLAVGFQNVKAHEEIEQLVADLRERNEQIQAQSEELQAQNEEIQAQNEEITAQQEELQAQNEELQAQNEEIQNQNIEIRTRSGELEELTGRLVTQTRMLEAADERKNEFLAMLAHELRNPMSALTMSLELLDHAAAGSEREFKAKDVIRRQVKQLVRLIDDLLDVTRIAQGKIAIRRDRVDLTQVVRECVRDQEAAFDAQGLTLDVDIPDEPAWIDGDASRLHQVVSNLLNNAVKFTEGGRRVWLRLSAPDSGEAVLEVRDEGIGIDPATLPHLFEPFRQGTNGSKLNNTGLGLGLTLVKNFTELHGGKVEASSDGPGRGATFSVRLPCMREGKAAPATYPEQRPSRNWRLLLVEDNAFVSWSLQEMLELEGHSVEVAHSGQQAIEKAKAIKPEAILCDIGLPDLDGYAVARTLAAHEEFENVALIALSGYSSQEDRKKSAEAGFVRHLVKPLDLPTFRAVLVELESRESPHFSSSGLDAAAASGLFSAGGEGDEAPSA